MDQLGLSWKLKNGWERWSPMVGNGEGQGNVYFSCIYSCTIPFLMKTLLFKLNYLYIQYAWISIMKTKMGRMKGWRYLSKLLTITITSFKYFNCPVKLLRNLKLKFRSKCNHDFTNHGYLHSGLKSFIQF